MPSAKKAKPLRARIRVGVVIHCEYFQTPDISAPYVDESTFHVASTLPKAIRYIRGCIMSDYSWWKVQQYGLNENNDEGEKRYFTHKGATVALPPYKRAMTAFKRWQKRQSGGK
jgi:hypothetical protein